MIENKNDPEFEQKLNELEANAFKSEQLTNLYEVLDILSGTDSNEERINKIYQSILEIALEHLANKLEAKETFKLEDENELYTLRALYEYAINHYSNNDYKGASELFLMLSILTEEPSIKFTMQLHAVASAEHLKFEDFVDTYIDIETLQNDENAIFMDRFKDGAQEYVNSKSSTLQKLYKLYQDKG